MLILFVEDGGPHCDVAFLKYAPEHVASLLITRIPEAGAPEAIVHLHDGELESRMWLDVQKREPLITLFQDPNEDFIRSQNKGNDMDFRWALDFEGKEMYDGRVTTDPAGLKSILRINDGTFYTQQKSVNALGIIRGITAKRLGRVAVRLRTEITLGRSERAIFSNGANGTQFSLEPVAGINYGIYVSQIRHDHNVGHARDLDAIDGENYNYAIAVDLPTSRKIHFERHGSRVTPDAACFTPIMGNG
jgi:hypothetical protein